jgi:Helix-hairpin-helix motif
MRERRQPTRLFYPGEITACAALATVCLLALGVQRGLAREPHAELHPVRLDLNRASTGELCALPGVGPVAASRVLAARPFASVEEARPVLGERTFTRVRPYLYVATPPAAAGFEPGGP